MKDFTDAEWARGRAALVDQRSPAFLDRLYRRLEAAEPRPEWPEAMAWRWSLRHRRAAMANAVTEFLRGVARGRQRDEQEMVGDERVAAVLAGMHRASSAAECMHSVLRMQQSRHHRMTQPMPDFRPGRMVSAAFWPKSPGYPYRQAWNTVTRFARPSAGSSSLAARTPSPSRPATKPFDSRGGSTAR